MKKEFAVAPAADLSKLKTGDKVRFTLSGSGNSYTDTKPMIRTRQSSPYSPPRHVGNDTLPSMTSEETGGRAGECRDHTISTIRSRSRTPRLHRQHRPGRVALAQISPAVEQATAITTQKYGLRQKSPACGAATKIAPTEMPASAIEPKKILSIVMSDLFAAIAVH